MQTMTQEKAAEIFYSKRISGIKILAENVIKTALNDISLLENKEVYIIEPADVSAGSETINWSVAHIIRKYFQDSGYIVKFQTRAKLNNPTARECLNIGIFGK